MLSATNAVSPVGAASHICSFRFLAWLECAGFCRLTLKFIAPLYGEWVNAVIFAGPQSVNLGYQYPAGYAVQSGTLLLDLSHLSSIKVLPGGRAVVGAGARLGPLYYQIWQQGRQIFPAGTCPSVGVGGHLLGTCDS